MATLAQADSGAGSATARRRPTGSSMRIVVPPGLAAEHQQIAARLAQQLARLIGADAVAAALVVAKGRNRLVADELGRHPRPLVDDVDQPR